MLTSTCSFVGEEATSQRLRCCRSESPCCCYPALAHTGDIYSSSPGSQTCLLQTTSRRFCALDPQTKKNTHTDQQQHHQRRAARGEPIAQNDSATRHTLPLPGTTLPFNPHSSHGSRLGQDCLSRQRPDAQVQRPRSRNRVRSSRLRALRRGRGPGRAGGWARGRSFQDPREGK